MVYKPLIRPAISWGGSFGGGVARIPLTVRDGTFGFGFLRVPGGDSPNLP